MMAVAALASPRPVALSLLVVSAAVMWAGRPARLAAPGAEARLSTAPVPAHVGPWTGTPLAVGQRAVDILETDAVSLMEYRRGGRPPVWLAQVAGFGNRAAFHPPEICYVGSHFEVVERGPVSVVVNGVARRLMRLVIAQDRDRYEAWYWFTANGRVTPSYYQQQWWLVTATMRRHPSSGTLVRISTPLDQPQAAHRRLLDFVVAWDAAQPPKAPHG